MRLLALTIGTMFQHTAARRRLPLEKKLIGADVKVSTHSRAEAAACVNRVKSAYPLMVSTHSRAEAAASNEL